MAKRLDRFILAESLLEKEMMFKQWVDLVADLDHFPIYLEIMRNPKNLANPFKFCATWIKNE